MIGVRTLSCALAALPHTKYGKNSKRYYRELIIEAFGDRKPIAVAININVNEARAHVDRAMKAIVGEKR